MSFLDGPFTEFARFDCDEQVWLWVQAGLGGFCETGQLCGSRGGAGGVEGATGEEDGREVIEGVEVGREGGEDVAREFGEQHRGEEGKGGGGWVFPTILLPCVVYIYAPRPGRAGLKISLSIILCNIATYMYVCHAYGG